MRILGSFTRYATVGVVELKGRVACEISSADEIVLTELIFGGNFKELSAEQLVAVLSCFVWQEKSKTAPKLREELAGPYSQLRDVARRVGKAQLDAKVQSTVSPMLSSLIAVHWDLKSLYQPLQPGGQNCKHMRLNGVIAFKATWILKVDSLCAHVNQMSIDVEQYVASFRPDIMEVAYAWTTGAKFSEIMKMTDAFEGSLIRAFKRLEEVLQQLIMASRSIGAAELETTFQEAVSKIKRDIVFAASLYL